MRRSEVASSSFDPVITTAARRRLGTRRILAGLAAALVLFAAATARLFIWPTSGMPEHVDAIVVLAGNGKRQQAGLRLAEDHRAPVLVVSRGYEGFAGPCPRRVPRLKLICFDPKPATTQGEAEFVGRLARRDKWHSVALVTSVAQDSRARQRMERCFNGRVYVVTVSVPWPSMLKEIAYEWAATMKMYVWQRSC